jgi:Domain of unknown function (DUF4124)
MLKPIVVAVLVFALQSAHAELTKCISADGTVVYSDKPCANSQRSQAVKVQPQNKTQPAAQVSDTASPISVEDPQSNSNTFVFDQLCAERKRLFDKRKAQVDPRDDLELDILGHSLKRYNEDCSSEKRAEEVKRDIEVHQLECAESRMVLKQILSATEQKSADIRQRQDWIRRNCPDL